MRVDSKTSRYATLDSLRGLAALTVLFCHFSNVIPNMTEDPTKFIWIKYTPFALFRAGYEAVIFFFVLSGFVLSLPFLEREVATGPFIVKRVFRIYPAYWVAIFISACFVTQFYTQDMSRWGSFVTSTWNKPVDFKLLAQHFFLLGNFEHSRLDPIVWTLVHEMRISILFPFLIPILKKLNSWQVFIFGYFLSCAGIGINHFMSRYTANDYFLSVHYAGFFVLGYLAARNKDILVQSIKTIADRYRLLLLIPAVLLYTYRLWFFPKSSILHWAPINDWINAFGALYFIIWAIAESKGTGFLKWGPVHYLGRISYSLYLYHAVAILAVLHLLDTRLSLPALWLTAFILTIFLASSSYFFVELPFIKIGKRITEKYEANARR